MEVDDSKKTTVYDTLLKAKPKNLLKPSETPSQNHLN